MNKELRNALEWLNTLGAHGENTFTFYAIQTSSTRSEHFTFHAIQTSSMRSEHYAIQTSSTRSEHFTFHAIQTSTQHTVRTFNISCNTDLKHTVRTFHISRNTDLKHTVRTFHISCNTDLKLVSDVAVAVDVRTGRWSWANPVAFLKQNTPTGIRDLPSTTLHCESKKGPLYFCP